MKNLLMTAAAAAMVLTAGNMNAQSAQAQETVEVEMATQDGFKEIKASQLPEAVTSAVEKDFKGASIAKAFMNDQKEYKLMLKMEGASEAKTVYANAKGEWIKK
ncbi:hypothetical protein [Mesonia maritima]|uniref:3-mercaptopyruvate sulfurtransferase SseA n=1 Tax=Mesonia maritima TaxID=1793873 RepID=A0ABU1K4M9_9FLAO|nr:hypothetical protein [Mesonia maritima]MDR6299533.1 3-mercaptopyruvate sulfurtransferase SseA [Mesonia maritima]